VHHLLSLDNQLMADLLGQLSLLVAHSESLKAEEAEVDSFHSARERELQRKIDFERSLVERQRDYMEQELAKKVSEERKIVAEKRNIRGVNEEVQKLKRELEKQEREAQLMGMIADNYHKEIARRKAASAAANSNTEESSQRNNVQSANMVLFLTKKMH
jgi:glutamate mutase epsilon subunit